MEPVFKNMDYLIKHWAPFSRQFPASFPVQSIGYIAEKRDRVRQAFSTCNFSFILSGGGNYRWRGTEWKVEAPCVLLQIPGEWVEYGPEAPHESWEEVFVIFGSACLKSFKKIGFIRESQPLWSVRNAALLREHLEELGQLASNAGEEGNADRADRVCERMILDSLLGGGGERQEEGHLAELDAALFRMRREVQKRFAEVIDWEKLAVDVGISGATFRRHWARLFHEAPGRYKNMLQMQHASRLLVETRLPISEIGRRCGFQDPLYFSRRFREETGVSARTYRATHQRVFTPPTAHPQPQFESGRR